MNKRWRTKHEIEKINNNGGMLCNHSIYGNRTDRLR